MRIAQSITGVLALSPELSGVPTGRAPPDWPLPGARRPEKAFRPESSCEDRQTGPGHTPLHRENHSVCKASKYPQDPGLSRVGYFREKNDFFFPLNIIQEFFYAYI